MSYDLTNGKQQVSVFPFQELKSVYANEILYNLFQPGVYDSGLSISNGGTIDTLVITIKAGTTLMFNRTDTNSDLFVGKCVLGANASLSILKSQLWDGVTNPGYSTSLKLYIVADWQYNVQTPTQTGVQFSIENDSSIIPVLALNGTNTHKLIVGTIINHQYYVDYWAASGSSLAYAAPLFYYKVAYEMQTNRQLMNKTTNLNSQFMVTFSGDGRGVTVTTGTFMTGGATVNQTATTSIMLPPVGLMTYVSSVVNNTVINIAGSESSYYQVDFLRAKVDEVTHAKVFVWESFLQPVGGTPLDFTNFDVTGGLSQASIKAWLAQYEFPIVGDGMTLLIVVRQRAQIPTIDNPSTNKIWPDSSVYPRESAMPVPSIGSAKYHTRFKLPVWNYTDLT